MLFFRKKKSAVPAGSGSYDRDRQEPVLRCSICTGEQVAGFLDKSSGTFQEVMLVSELKKELKHILKQQNF